MTSEHFEVAILGQQLPGLLLAAELARAGRRVVVLQTEEEEAAPRSPGLDPTAFAYVLESLEAHVPHLRAANQAMGLSLGPARPAAPLGLPAACQAQVIFPHGRITLPSAAATTAEAENKGQPEATFGAQRGVTHSLVAELAAEFPASRAWAASWTRAIEQENHRLSPLMASCRSGPPPTMWGRWQARQIGAQLQAWGQPALTSAVLPAAIEAEFGRLHMGLLPFVAGCGPQAASLLQTVRIWSRLLEGGPLNAELITAEALIPNFLAAATSAGAHIPEDQPLVRLYGSARQLTLCDLGGRKGQMGADLFVINSAGPLPAALLTSPTAARLQRALYRLPPATGHLGRYRLEVEADCVPASLAPLALLLDGRDSRPPGEPADPPLCLRRAPTINSRVSLTVECPLAGSGEAAGGSCGAEVHQTAALKHIAPRLGRLMPYLGAQAAAGRWALGGPPLYSLPSSSKNGWQRLQVYGQKTGVENLFDGRAEVVAGLGLEGSYLLAQLTSAALSRAAGGAWHRSRS